MKRFFLVPVPLRGGGDAGEWAGVDSWLAAVNAVALAFVVMAWMVGRSEGVRPLVVEGVKVEEGAAAAYVEVDLSPMAGAEGAAALEEVAAALPEAAGYPELEALVEAVAAPSAPLVQPVRPAQPVRAVGPGAAPVRGEALRQAAVSAAVGGAGPKVGRASGSGAVPVVAAGGGGVGRGVNPEPGYPAFARRERLQGTVVLRIAVRDGAVAGVVVVRSSGSGALDRHAVGHVERRWRWAAGTEQTFTQSFRFVLQ